MSETTPGKCHACQGAKRPKASEYIVLRHGQKLAVCTGCRLPRDETLSIVSREAFKVELHPTPEQIVLFRKHCGLVRFVYNWGLYRRKTWWNANKDLPKSERSIEPHGRHVLSGLWTKEHPE